jgi:hypothetical protein
MPPPITNAEPIKSAISTLWFSTTGVVVLGKASPYRCVLLLSLN